MIVAVIGHHTRAAAAERLAADLHATLFLDTDDHGPTWNHLRALHWGAQHPGEHLIVLEDDACPVPTFKAHAAQWIRNYPHDLISFYLGTNRPPQWMPQVDQRLKTAGDHITLPQLIHAVCYTIPTDRIPHVNSNRRADFGLGTAWVRTTGRQVVYPVRSLVDHADLPSLHRHTDEPSRRARQLAL